MSKKISALPPITVQKSTDLYENCDPGVLSTKESRLQRDNYTKNFISSKQIATLTTTSAISALQIHNGEIKLDPADELQEFTLPTKALLYAQMGSPPVNSSIPCQIPNISDFISTLVNSDFDITGMPSLIVPKKSTFDLNFVVTQTSPLLMSILGGFIDELLTSPLSPELGGTGTPDLPSHGKILVGNSGSTYDVATVVGSGNIVVAYSEIFKQLTIDDSSAIIMLPFGYWFGLHVSYVSTTMINMALGAALDSNNLYNIYSGSNDLDTSVTGINGIDTGTVDPNSQYYIYNIGDSTQVNPGRVTASLSPVSPTLTSPYDTFRGIGSFQTDGSSRVIENSIVDLINKAPLHDPSITGSMAIDTIVGRTGDLRINPFASGGTVFIGHDQAESNAVVGEGSTQSSFKVRDSSGTNFEVNIDGDTVVSNKLIANNNSPTLVFIDGINGVNDPGNGSYYNPYKTVAYAESQITDASITKQYTIIFSGKITETQSVSLKGNISIIGEGSSSTTWEIPSPFTLSLDSSVGIGDCSMEINGFYFINPAGTVLDFGSFTNDISSNFTDIQTYDSFQIIDSVAVSHKISNCSFETGSALIITDPINIKIDSTNVFGSYIVNSNSTGNTGSVYALDCDMMQSSPHIVSLSGSDSLYIEYNNCKVFNADFQVLAGDLGQFLSITTRNGSNFNQLNWQDDSPSGTRISFSRDAESVPLTINLISGNSSNQISLTDVSSGVDTYNGFADGSPTSNFNNFRYTATLRSDGDNFVHGNSCNPGSGIFNDVGGSGADANGFSGTLLRGQPGDSITASGDGQWIYSQTEAVLKVPKFAIEGTVFDKTSFSTISTSSTLTAAQLLGVSIFGAPTTNITYTLPTAATLFAGLGNLVYVGKTFKTKFTNITATDGVKITLASSDTDLPVTGIYTIIVKNACAEVEFTLTQISPPIFKLTGGFLQVDLSDIAKLSANNTYTGNNTFSAPVEFDDLTLFTDNAYYTDDAAFIAIESTYNTTSTITADDLANKVIKSTPGAGGITLTLPTASDLNTRLGSPPPNTAIENISITNLSMTDTITLASGTNHSLSGVPSPIILPGTTRFFKDRKSATTPAFVVYG